ncbi:acylneuraminate cytidylyltransferase [Vibrio cidicii]|uniref:Acylneuraminate cytidylyltransferase n=1 Tax=Vibrio cidicii TaxID=1763883 RepID=A0ABR5W0G6_9VIBR|nr:acylneuraminate cytidylyltransferase family protein [Vibrio cidicii]KYN85339.1 acylneuraminate cytidylyltransferase [Vibrio cidicii]
MLTVFLPCRKGSQRIPNKNVKDFAGVKGGLLNIKLSQLIKVSKIDKIVVSSNDERVLEFANSFDEARIVIDERPDNLGSSATTTDELINYVPSIINNGDILWTHVTSPFIDACDYSDAIDTFYNRKKEGFDSLMTVTKLQGFIWGNNGPINYDRTALKWPMTQNIKPLFEVDSGIFIASVNNYRQFGDRIGSNPYLLIQQKLKSIDIDWPEDFNLAEKLWVQNCNVN